MFEKESDEYIKKDGTKAEKIFTMLNKIEPLKITVKQAPFLLAMTRQVFQDAAEFGYNKGKAELEEVTARLEKQKEINKELLDLQEETIKTFNRTIEEVKCLINDLLDNSDEYARQRARDYLERAKP